MAISRREKPVPTSLPATRLYLEDIEEIDRIFTEALTEYVASDKPIKKSFILGDRICDELHDLPKIAKATRKFEMKFSKDWHDIALSVDWHATEVRLYGLSVEEQWRVFRRLEPIFDSRKFRWRRFSHGIFDGTLRGLAWFVLPFPTFLLLAWLLTKFLSFRFGFLAASVVPIAFYGAIGIGFSRHTTVVFRHSSEAAALREERLWKVGWEVLKNIFVFGLGILTAYLKHKYWP